MRGSGQPNLKLKSSLFQKHQCWYRIRANYNNLLLSLNTSFRITFAKLSRWTTLFYHGSGPEGWDPDGTAAPQMVKFVSVRITAYTAVNIKRVYKIKTRRSPSLRHDLAGVCYLVKFTDWADGGGGQVSLWEGWGVLFKNMDQCLPGVNPI